ETLLPNTAIKSVADNQILVDVPNLFLTANTTSLSVRVLKGNLAYTRHGAVVVLPRVVIEDVNPLRGPPEGGNVVDIYGRGFNYGTRISIGEKLAGDLRVISGNHIQVRAPANSFGFAKIK